MRILFASLGAYGHLYPMMPLALAAADAGHEVAVATGDPFLDRLPLPPLLLTPASASKTLSPRPDAAIPRPRVGS